MRLAVVACLALMGCASVQPSQTGVTRHMKGIEPAVGQEARASVGSSVLSQFDYLAAARGVVQQGYSRAVGLNTIRLAGGEALVPSVLGGSREAWCSTGPVWFALGEARSACFFQAAGTTAPGELAILRQAYILGTAMGTELDVEVPIRVEPVGTGTGYKYELFYQGRDRGGVRLSYREYTNDMARPAFSQDVVYDVMPGPGTTITFRQARLEILAAGNDEIRYRVLAPFR